MFRKYGNSRQNLLLMSEYIKIENNCAPQTLYKAKKKTF